MSKERWLGLVGIGEDGIDGLVPAARRLIAQADFIVGGKRHLALAGSLKAETMVWPSPIENALLSAISVARIAADPRTRLMDRRCELKGGAAGRVCARPQPTAMRFDDRPADRQPQP